MLSSGIEPGSLKPLTRHSNQLTYAANFPAAPLLIFGTSRHCLDRKISISRL